MLKKLIVLPPAEQDIRDAMLWYESRKPGLGQDLLRCINTCLSSIQRNPELYGYAYESYRRALVRRFPYAVFYEDRKEGVVVYSVFHCALNPDKWSARLP